MVVMNAGGQRIETGLATLKTGDSRIVFSTAYQPILEATVALVGFEAKAPVRRLKFTVRKFDNNGIDLDADWDGGNVTAAYISWLAIGL